MEAAGAPTCRAGLEGLADPASVLAVQAAHHAERIGVVRPLLGAVGLFVPAERAEGLRARAPNPRVVGAEGGIGEREERGVGLAAGDQRLGPGEGARQLGEQRGALCRIYRRGGPDLAGDRRLAKAAPRSSSFTIAATSP